MALLVFTTTYLVAVLLHPGRRRARTERARAGVPVHLPRVALAAGHHLRALRGVHGGAGVGRSGSGQRRRQPLRGERAAHGRPARRHLSGESRERPYAPSCGQHIDQARSVEWPAMATREGDSDGCLDITGPGPRNRAGAGHHDAPGTDGRAAGGHRRAGRRAGRAAAADPGEPRGGQRRQMERAFLLQALCTLVAIALVHGENRIPPRIAGWASSRRRSPSASC